MIGSKGGFGNRFLNKMPLRKLPEWHSKFKLVRIISITWVLGFQTRVVVHFLYPQREQQVFGF
jgi:hypothetical protein